MGVCLTFPPYAARMFGFRLSSVFRSRWMALFWAAGIVWMAVDLIGTPDPEQDAPGGATQAASGHAQDQDAAAVRHFLDGK